MKTLREAVDEVAALGSADDIAQFLKERNVKGEPMSGCRCPLAVYLRHETGNTVRVTHEAIFFERSGLVLGEFVRTPENVREFIERTDRSSIYKFLLIEPWARMSASDKEKSENS